MLIIGCDCLFKLTSSSLQYCINRKFKGQTVEENVKVSYLFNYKIWKKYSVSKSWEMSPVRNYILALYIICNFTILTHMFHISDFNFEILRFVFTLSVQGAGILFPAPFPPQKHGGGRGGGCTRSPSPSPSQHLSRTKFLSLWGGCLRVTSIWQSWPQYYP